MLPKKAKELIQALVWIQQNLFRQDAVTTAVYWLEQTEYPCAEARASIMTVSQSTLKMSPTLEAALRRANVFDLYIAFQPLF